MTLNLSNIGMKMKHLRENANLTQKQIADFLSVDQSLISKFEKGERSINSDLLNQLSALFCYPVSALISEENIIPTYTVAFRTAAFDNTDLTALTAINKIVLNQFKMDQLAGGIGNDQ